VNPILEQVLNADQDVWIEIFNGQSFYGTVVEIEEGFIKIVCGHPDGEFSATIWAIRIDQIVTAAIQSSIPQ
jgi:hypothetical protein